MQLIGIHGRKGNGKSLLAHKLTVHYCDTVKDTEIVVLPLALKLKQMCHIVFGGEFRHWFGTDKDKSETEPFKFWANLYGEPYSCARRILQTIGTEVFRNNVSNDFWLRCVENMMLTEYKNHVVVIDDVRYENEANFILRMGGKVYETVYFHAKPSTDQHSSEKPLPRDMITLSRTSMNETDLQSFAEEIVRGLYQP